MITVTGLMLHSEWSPSEISVNRIDENTFSVNPINDLFNADGVLFNIGIFNEGTAEFVQLELDDPCVLWDGMTITIEL